MTTDMRKNTSVPVSGGRRFIIPKESAPMPDNLSTLLPLGDQIPPDDQIILKYFQKEFNNRVLQTQLIRQESAQASQATSPVPDFNPPQASVADLNYNTKANYVNFLHEKIVELHRLRLKEGSLSLHQDLTKARAELESTKKEYMGLVSRHSEVKRQLLDAKKRLDNLEPLRSQGKDMRRALLLFYYTHTIDRDTLAGFSLDRPNPLFDDDEIAAMIKQLQFQSDNRGKIGLNSLGSKDLEYATILGQKNRNIIDLQTQIRTLMSEGDKLKEKLKVRGVSPKKVEAQLKDLRTKLTEEATTARNEATVRIEDLTKKLRLSESLRVKETMKVTQVKRDNAEQLRVAGEKLAGLVTERDKYKRGFEEADATAKKLAKQLEKAQDEHKQFYNRMMNQSMVGPSVDSGKAQVIRLLAQIKRQLAEAGGEAVSVDMTQSIVRAIEDEFKNGDALAQRVSLLTEGNDALAVDTKRMKSDLEEIGKSVKTLQTQKAELEEVSGRRARELEDARRQMEVLSETIKQEKASAEILKGQVKDLETSLADRDGRIAEFPAQLEAKDQLLAEKQSVIESLEATIGGLNAKVRDLEAAVATVTAAKTAEVAAAEEQTRQEKQKFVDYLAAQKAELEKIMNGSKAEQMNDVFFLNSLIVRMKPILDEATKENAAMKDELGSLKVMYKETKEGLDRATEENMRLSTECMALKAETSAKIDSLETKLRASEDDNAKLMRQVENLDRTATESSKKNKENETQIVELKNQIKEQSGRLEQWERELADLRKYKATNEEWLGGAKDLTEIKARSYEMAERSRKFQELNETLVADNAKLKKQVESFAESVESLTALRGDLERQLREAQVLAETRTIERDTAKRELKVTGDKMKVLSDQLRDEREDFEKTQKEIVALRDKLFDLTKVDPRLNIQTRTYETEIRNLVLTNEQLNNEVARLKAAMKLQGKELDSRKEELAVLRALDVGVLQAKLSEREFQILEMVKMTNEQQLALEDAVGRRDAVVQDNIQLSQRVSLLQEALKALKDNKRKVEALNGAFLAAFRTEYGVTKDQEDTVEELKVLYKALGDLKEQLALARMETEADVLRNPLFQRKVLEVDTKERELNIRLESVAALEKRAERAMEDVRKAEERVKVAQRQTELQLERVTALEGQIRELDSALVEHKQLLASLKAEAKVKDEHLEILSKENSDLSDLLRNHGLQLATIKAELALAQQKVTTSTETERETRQELQAIQAENLELQEAVIANTENFLNKVHELQDSLDESEAQNGKLEDKISALQGEVAELRQRLEAETTKADGLNYRLDYLTKLNEKYSRLLKLPADFAEKLTNYDDFIERFNELQEDNVMKQKRIESLEIRLEEAKRGLPQRTEASGSFQEAADGSSLTFEDETPRDRNRKHFATTMERPSIVVRKSIDGADTRMADLNRRLEDKEREIKALKANLNAYVARAKNMSESSSLRVKEFMTSAIIDQDDLKAELAARNRKIDSLHQNAARVFEDYRSVRETLDKTQARLKKRSEDFRKSETEKAALLSENQHLKEQLGLVGVVREEDVSAANLAVIRLLQEKEAAHKQVVAILQDTIDRMAADKTESNDAEQVIRRLQMELKEARDGIDKLEMKCQTTTAASKAANTQLEAQRAILVKTQKDLDEALESIQAEQTKVRKGEEELAAQMMLQKTLQNQVESLTDQLENQRATAEALREELALLQEGDDEEELDKNERMFQKLDQKEKEIHRLRMQLKEHGECTVTIQDQKRTLADHETELKSMRIEKARLETEAASLTADRQRYLDEARERERMQVLLKDELQVVTANLKKQTENVSVLQTNNSALREKIRDLVISFGTKNAEHKEVIEQLGAEVMGVKHALIRVLQRRRPGPLQAIPEEESAPGETPDE